MPVALIMKFAANPAFAWSNDSQYIVFQSDREGDLGLFWQRADGTGRAERLTTPKTGASHVPESWSPTSGTFTYSETVDSSVSLCAYSIRDRKATPFPGVHSTNPFNSVFSPDGRWVAYSSSEVIGYPGPLYLQRFPPTDDRWEIAKAGNHPLWSPDGKEVFQDPAAGQIVAVPITTSHGVSFGDPIPLKKGFVQTGPASLRNYSIRPDGRFVGVVAAGLAESAGVPRFEVVLNWFEELKARVPSKY